MAQTAYDPNIANPDLVPPCDASLDPTQKVCIDGAGAGATQVQGADADGAPSTGNPVLIAGEDALGNVQTVLVGIDGKIAIQALVDGDINLTATDEITINGKNAAVATLPLNVSAANEARTDTSRVALVQHVDPDGSVSQQVHGTVAHDAADAGNPVGIGGVASPTAPADVTDGNRVAAWFRNNGALATYEAYGLNSTDDKVDVELLGGQPVDLGAGAVDVGTQRVTLANDDQAVSSLGTLTSVVEGSLSAARTLELGATAQPAITVSLGAYTSGDVVGGIITLATLHPTGGRQVELRSLTLKDVADEKPALNIYFFKNTPAGGTYTDNAALVWDAADLGNLVGFVKVLAADWETEAGQAIVSFSDIGAVMNMAGSDLYMLIVAKSAPDYDAVTDLSISLGFRLM